MLASTVDLENQDQLPIKEVFEGMVMITLEPHYNAHFGVHSDMSAITEQPYNDGLKHRKHKQGVPCL